ncbi:ribosome maturation factor RimM [Lapillicoccus sp.]|uniref:ribosome maturation factor RimM n=1 Tax=Lapillicoccus sp. TaxID=1909287 RepID=UPI00326680FF
MAGTELVVARIGKPHGLLGEVTVQLHTDDPERRLVTGATFATQAQPGSGVPRTLTLRSTRVHNGTWLLAFEQIPDRTGAESLRGTQLLADVDDLQRLDDDDDEGWYEDELLGLAVVTRDGRQVGTVSGLQTGTVQDLLVVALTGGGDAYLPFVEAIVPEVDVPAGRVVVAPPDGLLELNT